MLLRTCAAALGAALLASCASLNNRPEIDWQHGARHGVVAGFYTPETAMDMLPECLSRMPKATLAERHFVSVRYRHVRHHAYAVVEVADVRPLSIGMEVEVLPDDCAHDQFGRIVRILSATPQP
ncbi:hypothetical protein [Actimicrobium antarcticum]|uniref:Lipoprotein n=1 Tax=Actimicrobium antarcticum TaxID=1051899 RepID=A0ABP7T6D9_9BURK